MPSIGRADSRASTGRPARRYLPSQLWRIFVRQQVAVAKLVLPVGEIAAPDAVLGAAVMLEPVAAEIVGDRQQEVVMVVMLRPEQSSPPVRPGACARRSARALRQALPRCRRSRRARRPATARSADSALRRSAANPSGSRSSSPDSRCGCRSGRSGEARWRPSSPSERSPTPAPGCRGRNSRRDTSTWRPTGCSPCRASSTSRPWLAAVGDRYWKSTSTALTPCGTVDVEGVDVERVAHPLQLACRPRVARKPATFLISSRGL